MCDSPAFHRDTAKLCPSIMLSTCWTTAENWEKKRENIPLNRSIITTTTSPYISQQAFSSPEKKQISIVGNSLKIILLDWTNVYMESG